MAVPFVIRCRSCSTKLNIKKESLVGKKIACPKCKKAVHILDPDADAPEQDAPTAASAAVRAAVADTGKPKKRKASSAKKTKAARKNDFDDFEDDDYLEDDFGDDYADDDYGDDDDFGDDDYEDDFEQPARRSGASKNKSKGKKTPAKKKGGSKTPLIIGASIAGLLLVGGLTWFLLPDGEAEGGGNATANSDSTGDGTGATAMGDGGQSSDGDTGMVSTKPVDPSLPMAWLPPKSELIMRIDMKSLYNSPLVQKIVENPMAAGGLEDLRTATGMGPEDIESFIFATDSIPVPTPGQPPTQQQETGIAVIRLSKDISQEQLEGFSQDVQTATHEGMTYLTMPNPQNGSVSAIYMADARTLVTGPEDYVHRAMLQGSSPKMQTDFSYVKASGVNVITAFSPKNPKELFGRIPVPPISPQVTDAITKMKTSLQALSVGLDVGSDIGVKISMKCPDSGNAAELQQAMSGVVDFGKQALEGSLANAGFMERPYLMMGKALLDNSRMEVEDGVVQFSGTSEKAGETLANQVALLAPMIIGQMQQAMGGGGGGQGFGPGGSGFGPEGNGFAGNGGPGGNSGPGMSPEAGPGGNTSTGFTDSGEFSPDAFPPGGFSPDVNAGNDAGEFRPGNPQDMKKLAIAMQKYHDDENALPDLAITDESGTPLLSWRVRILPYIGEQELYSRFKLNEPWDSRSNKELIKEMPAIFGIGGKTTFVAVSGEGTAFADGKGCKLFDVTDGMHETILLLSGPPQQAVTWTEPKDFTYKVSTGTSQLGGGFVACMVDGDVRPVRGNEAAKMFTIAAGD